MSALCVLVVGAASAQDSHYWTEQYGNRARLLGGAVVGGNNDLSAVYYNPGSLALVDKPEILLSGNVFEYTSYTLSSDERPNDLTNSSFSLSPSLFAGEIRWDSLGDNRIAYSFLTRARTDVRFPGRAELSSADVDVPDLELATNRSLLSHQMNEYWFGATWARSLGERVGLGVTTFFAVRNAQLLAQDVLTLLTSEEKAALSLLARDYNYNNWRVLWKIGLGTEFKKWELGLTVTTPGVNLFGSGGTGVDETSVGQDVDNDGNALTSVNADSQAGISSEYRSPPSIAFGAARVFGGTSVNFTGEWFGSVDEYAILRAEPFEGQTSGELIDTSVIADADSVFNVAVGVEQALSGGKKLYGGFHTDFSSTRDGSRSNSSATGLDLYHVSGGMTFTVSGSELTAGAMVSFGETTNPRFIDVPDFGFDLRPDLLTLSYFRFTFILGYKFQFL